MRVGIIGFGKMGEAIASGLTRKGFKENRFKVQATTLSEEGAKTQSKRFSISCHTDNHELLRTSDIIILCVKPYQVEKLLKDISPSFRKGQLLLSICASVTTEQLRKWTDGKVAVIRAMPNTPCLIGRGMTALCIHPLGLDTSVPKNSSARTIRSGPRRGGDRKSIEKSKEVRLAREIFESIGSTVLVEESMMDAVTGISGCGPAYVYLIVEALSDAGVRLGLPRQLATHLAAQTLSGASQMVLDRKLHPAELKDEVTTPAGCTIEGLMALEEGKLRVTLIKAVVAAAERSANPRKF